MPLHSLCVLAFAEVQVVHVEVVRAYGRLVRLVLQHGQLLRQLQGATAALQREAQLWEEVPVAKEAACYRFKEEIDRISQEIEVGRGCLLWVRCSSNNAVQGIVCDGQLHKHR